MQIINVDDEFEFRIEPLHPLLGWGLKLTIDDPDLDAELVDVDLPLHKVLSLIEGLEKELDALSVENPENPCPTKYCPGDGRYAAPGRRHREGCTYPIGTELRTDGA